MLFSEHYNPIGYESETKFFAFKEAIKRWPGPSSWQSLEHLLKVQGDVAFLCCGSGVISHLGSKKTLSEENKQNFLCAWLSRFGIQSTYYFIASTAQLKSPSPVLSFLINDLGAFQIDETPNRYHGPNSMHMHRLCLHPTYNTNLTKYVTYTKSVYSDLQWAPIWWTNLSEMQQEKWVTKHQSEIQLSKALDTYATERQHANTLSQHKHAIKMAAAYEWDCFKDAVVDSYNNVESNRRAVPEQLDRWAQLIDGLKEKIDFVRPAAVPKSKPRTTVRKKVVGKENE